MPQPNISFRSGLNSEQIGSINNLWSTRSQDTWNTNDWSNWNYATNNSSVPTQDWYTPNNNFPDSAPQQEAPYISSTSGVVTAENNLSNLISSLGTPNTSEQTARDSSQAFTDEIQRQIDAFEERRKSQLEEINKQFDLQRGEVTKAQARETASTGTGIVRVGGYLGESGSGMGVMQNLADTHRVELAKLEATRASALSAANSAINEKQFSLAQAKAKEVKDLDKAIEDRRNTFFTQALQLLQENRLQNAAFYDIVKDIPAGQTKVINGVEYTGIAEPEAFFKSSDLVSLMKELNVGETQTIFDPNLGKDVTITGLRTDDPSIKSISSYDNAGNLTITSYKIGPTGAQLINQVGAGRVGKAKTTGGGGAQLTRTILNKLNAKGLPDDQALSIFNLLKNYDRPTAESLLAQGLAQQSADGNMSVDPNAATYQYGKTAKSMIDNYNSILNSASSWQDMISEQISAGLGSINLDQED